MKQRTAIKLVSFEVVPSIGTKPCLTDKLAQAGLARGTWDFRKRFQTRIISAIFYLDLFHLRDAPFAARRPAAFSVDNIPSLSMTKNL